MNRIDLLGKTSVVTGGAHGIGLAVAKRFLSSGARCIIWDHDAAKLAAAAKTLDHPDRVQTVKVDLTNEAQVNAAAEASHTRFGGVEMLVTNPGTAGTAEVSGATLACRAIVKLMLPRNEGHIVNLASLHRPDGSPIPTTGGAATAGIVGLTKSLAVEFAQTGIRVNCVAPPYLDTEAWASISSDPFGHFLSREPFGRYGRAEEIAALVSWLCSDECRFTTGAVFDISGAAIPKTVSNAV